MTVWTKINENTEVELWVTFYMDEIDAIRWDESKYTKEENELIDKIVWDYDFRENVYSQAEKEYKNSY